MVCIESVYLLRTREAKVLGVDVTFGLIEDWTCIMSDASRSDVAYRSYAINIYLVPSKHAQLVLQYISQG